MKRVLVILAGLALMLAPFGDTADARGGRGGGGRGARTGISGSSGRTGKTGKGDKNLQRQRETDELRDSLNDGKLGRRTR